MQIDLNKYQDFVREVTSDPSNHTDKLVDRLNELNTNHTLNPAFDVMEFLPLMIL